jgi:hypothetical protein
MLFEENLSKPKFRYKWPSGKTADVDIDSLSSGNKKNILNVDNPKLDDLINAKLECALQEISLFQVDGIRTFMFKDNLSDKDGLTQVSYEVEVSISTIFKEYITRIMNKLNKSISFLQRYINSIERSKVYNENTRQFKKSFTKETLQSVGIEYPFTSLRENVNKKVLNSSDFGQLSRNYYNAFLLLVPQVPPAIYDNIMTVLLPTAGSSPKKLRKLLNNMLSLQAEIDSVYSIKHSNINDRAKPTVKKIDRNDPVRVRAKEKIDIENDDIGYHVFSNDNSTNIITPQALRIRMGLESQKYYSKINNSSTLPGLLSSEKQQFKNLSNGPSFLTPTGVKSGQKTISFARGVFSIDPNDIAEFRLKKSLKAAKSKTSILKTSAVENKLSSESAATFNLTIGAPVLSSAVLSREKLTDKKIDANEYLGDNSFFITTAEELEKRNFSKLFKKFNKTNKRVLTKLIPKVFLRKRNGVKSASDFSLQNPNSKFNKAIKSNKVSIQNIPPQIRSLGLLNPAQPGQSDPIKNAETGQILKETQMNTYVIKYLDGFKQRPDGFLNVHEPVYLKLSNQIINSNRPFLVKAEDYELPEMGVFKDKNPVTIFNNLLYVRGGL